MRSLALPSLGLVSSRPLGPVSLISVGALHPALSFSRASPAAYIRSTDGALVEVGSGAPRFDPLRGLLIEGQRANGVRNPRGEGAVAGTPGTVPTNWFIPQPSLLSRQIVGTGIVNGLPYIDIRIVGTASALTYPATFFEVGTGIIPAASGQTWTVSAFVQLVAGALPGGLRFLGWEEYDAGNVFISNATSSPAAPTSQMQRISITRATANGTVASIRPFLSFEVANGQTVDYTLRIAAPQIEQAPFALSPILPPVGTPAATTRLSDALTAPLSSLGIPASGACTIVGTFMLPQQAAADAQIFFQIDDGSDNNRYFIRNIPNGTSIAGVAQLAGIGADTPSVTMSPGVPFRVALSISAGRVAFSLNGGAVNAITGGPTSGLAILRVGNAASVPRSLNGYAQSLGMLPFPLSDSALRNLAM